MREIKFRAWDKLDKRWVDIYYLKPQDNGLWVISGDGYGYSPERVDIVEYTGLEDGNGVEIYEGDILTGGYWSTVGYYGEGTFLVEFEEGAFMGFMCEYLKQERQRWSHSTPLYKLEKMEVIGNIYENKELLKVK